MSLARPNVSKPISSAARELLCIALQARDSPKPETVIKKEGVTSSAGEPSSGIELL